MAMSRTNARVVDDALLSPDVPPIPLNSPDWFVWLEHATTFAYTGDAGHFTARKEARARGGAYWKAYRTVNGASRRAYLGRSADVTLERLRTAAAQLVIGSTPSDWLRSAAPEFAPAQAETPSQFLDGLLHAKQFVPRLPTRLIGRPRLLHALDDGAAAALTLVVAPAGFGKTTLVSAWLDGLRARSGHTARIACVSLDAGDNDPKMFLRYLIAALQRMLPGIGPSMWQVLESTSAIDAARLMPMLLNDLAVALSTAQGTSAVLVLDEYHLIAHPVIHAAMALLIEHMPPNLRLILISRAEPALPLDRLRARNAMVEVRADDLRCTSDEVRALLRAITDVPLDEAATDLLDQRTEGWITGLRLAALACCTHHDPNHRIESFTGTHRLVDDYFATEVWDRMPTHLRAFVLQTSILDRMCGPLCDAVMLGGAGQGHDSFSQGLLEQLERVNLFVVPLDNTRRWYRYHHLFGDMLRQRLHFGVSADAITTLHQRAAAWYEANDLIDPAVQHATVAADWHMVARVISEHGPRIVLAGHMQRVLDWIDALPEEVVQAHPMLELMYALCALFLNRFLVVETWLARAEAHIQSLDDRSRVTVLDGIIAFGRGNMAYFRGDLEQAFALIHSALDWLSGDDIPAYAHHLVAICRAAAQVFLATDYHISGDVTVASEQRTAATIAPVQASGNLIAMFNSITYLARLQTLQGRLQAANATYAVAVQSVPQMDSLPLLGASASYYFGMAEIARERGQFDKAMRLIEQGMDVVRNTLAVDADVIWLGYLAAARLAMGRGDYADAHATLDAFVTLVRERSLWTGFERMVGAARAELALACGDRVAASAWAAASGFDPDAPPQFREECIAITMARVWIADDKGEHVPAFDQWLARWHSTTEVANRGDSVLTWLLLLAHRQQFQGNLAHAMELLEQALLIAAPEGYQRRFAEAGPAVLALLRLGVEPTPQIVPLRSHTARMYATRLLGALNPTLEQVIVATATPTAATNTSETLTAREREVLHLIAAGYTNAAIAERLIIATSTVKTHVNTILGKLDAHNRTEAVTRAQASGIL